MHRLKLPQWVEKHLSYKQIKDISDEKLEKLKKKLEKFKVLNPEVSIIIPAFNEEDNLLKTLSSLSDIQTSYRVELIVANNASTDNTQAILDKCGVQSIYVKQPGVSFARQAGLEKATGKYILNADADSIYPEDWVDAYVSTLKNPEISCVYGTYSFVPSKGKGRFNLGLYELFSKISFAHKKRHKEFINVFGFNFAFRKDDALKIGGFKHNLDRAKTGRCEDGMMAYDLMQIGKIHQIKSSKIRVWTSDRIFDRDGGFLKGIQKRIAKEVNRITVDMILSKST